MKFCIIDAKRKEVRIEDHPNLEAAERSAGLTGLGGGVDHGSLYRGVAYVVHGFGFMVPKNEQNYSRIGRQLVAGNAVLYGVGEAGQTVDITRIEKIERLKSHVVFYDDAGGVEEEIDLGIICRPCLRVIDDLSGPKGETLWSWPNPAPKHIADEISKGRK